MSDVAGANTIDAWWSKRRERVERRRAKTLKPLATMAVKYPDGTHCYGQPVQMFISPWLADSEGIQTRYVCQQGDFTL
jgi:hypothetical protein